MGAYLSEPLTTKDSADEGNELLLSGSSSMQGWRISQEDAHNCILNFDAKTSFFAVYDGHGGSEVAQYCSLHLPTFLKTLESYRAGNFEKALRDAFIGFDATLLEEKVIEELKKLSDKTNGEEAIEEDDEEEDEDDNVDDLCKEARMPLNEVLQMYKKEKCNPAISKIKEGNCSKPVSPFLKGKKKDLTSTAADEPGPSSSKAGPASSAEADESTVSSSSAKTESAPEKMDTTSSVSVKKADQSDEISDTDGNVPAEPMKEECAPDSSSSKAGEGGSNTGKQAAAAAPTINGDAAASGKSAVSSSSSAAAQENGVVSSNSNFPGGSSAAGASGTSGVDSSSPGSSSSATPAAGSKHRKAKNGPANMVDDDSEDDDSETDDEFPPVADANETSSTEDGEEDPEEASEEDDDEEGMYEEDEEEDYMNEDDEAFMNSITDEPGKDSGCTAVVALLHDKDLYVANAGDSRCVVCRSGKALEMSFDHKPEDQIEFERIQQAGGRVTLDGRVNGGLNLSRAIGDHGYKMNKKLPPEDQMISALPDIKKITVGAEDEFMVLACDGIWNFMTSDDVVEFVQERISDPTKKLSEICEEMFDYCLAPHTKGDGTGCDNMTAIIVRFKPNFTGAATRKRAVSPESETASDCKKLKTGPSASSSSNGNNSSETTPATESNTSADCADNTASSST